MPVEWIKEPPFWYRFLKRTFDIIFSSVALVLLSPVLLLIAVLIKLTSKGRILFTQTRIGYHGQPFQSFTFRSMYEFSASDSRIHKEYVKRLLNGDFGQAGEMPVFKMVNDPRITSVGKLLRRYSLDQLPQFINVFLGSMSIIGPQPPIRFEWEGYERRHKQKLSCKPGIAGPWQVDGLPNMTFDEMVKMELYYVNHQSFSLDLKIFFKTVLLAFTGRSKK